MNHKKTSISLSSILLTIIILSVTILPGLCDTRLTTNPADDWSPAMIQTSDGKIWVVWHSFRTGNADLFYKTHNGISWSTDKPLTNHTAPDGFPSIMQTSEGKIWVVWTSSRTGNYDLFYKTTSDGGTTWSTETPLTTDPNDDRHSSLMRTSDGKIWVVWQTKRAGNFDLFYKTSSDGGSTWSTETPLTTDANEDEEPSVTQTTDGKIWVVWASNRTGNEELFYKTSSDSGSSWTPETPLTTDPGVDSNPSIIQTKDGTIWVAWQADRNIQDDIYYKTYNGSSWSPEDQLTWYMDLDVMPSISQTANGTIWLVWASNKFENFDIYYKFVIPDIYILSVTTSSTQVPQGNLVDIYVDVGNEGTVGATFDVTAYFDSTAVGTRQWTMVPMAMAQRITFTWNTAGVSLGNYVISAKAAPVIGEIDTADNTYVDGIITVGIHDVAVKNVTPSQTVAHRGYTTVYIYVQVKNEGTFSETFNVTAYCNSTQIGTQTVTLNPNSETTVTFSWDTAGASYGNCTISAKTSTILYEKDLTDNSLSDGIVTVTVPGDVNHDKKVNILDASEVSAHWYPGPPVGPLGYDSNSDINGDGRVDMTEAAIINANWQKSW